jgi:hypothetical protein
VLRNIRFLKAWIKTEQHYWGVWISQIWFRKNIKVDFETIIGGGIEFLNQFYIF